MTTHLETIRAAIERLEKLKSDSTPGPWHSPDEDGWIESHAGYAVMADDDMNHLGGPNGRASQVEYEHPANGELIVTLHRTIDAQLEILRLGLDLPIRWDENSAWLHLAEAILGDAE